jgi:hypothetical protein
MASKIILKRLKELGTIWHPESTVVFKSKEDKVVIGRWDGVVLIDLDNDTIDECEKWGFKIDETLIDEISEEEDSNVEPPEEIEASDGEEDSNVEPQLVDKGDSTNTDVVVSQLAVVVAESPLQCDDIISKIKSVFGDLETSRKELVVTNQLLADTISQLRALEQKFTTLKSLLG